MRTLPATAATTYAQLPITRPNERPDRQLATRPTSDPIVAGFYVNWDDNSLASLRSHIDAFDWVVAEWGFVGRGGDTLPGRFEGRDSVLALTKLAQQPPLVFALITNYTGEGFDARPVAP